MKNCTRCKRSKTDAEFEIPYRLSYSKKSQCWSCNLDYNQEQLKPLHKKHNKLRITDDEKQVLETSHPELVFIQLQAYGSVAKLLRSSGYVADALSWENKLPQDEVDEEQELTNEQIQELAKKSAEKATTDAEKKLWKTVESSARVGWDENHKKYWKKKLPEGLLPQDLLHIVEVRTIRREARAALQAGNLPLVQKWFEIAANPFNTFIGARWLNGTTGLYDGGMVDINSDGSLKILKPEVVEAASKDGINVLSYRLPLPLNSTQIQFLKDRSGLSFITEKE